MRYKRNIEQCEYCDISYHPMTRWSNDSGVIFVHEIAIGEKITLDDTCIKIAQKNGYIRRRDLTPSR